ncbi:MAG: DNA polymerase III subunit beta [Dehalococcoidia bacterium]|jgi:DNA polymerase-3 subunit beta|nr:DNA polymerase III subunit beta [Dehalococcoidia bacterium]
MRLSCQQEDLHRGLSAVARAIPARSALPITQHVLLTADGDQITLSATDAETIAITYTITASIDEGGSITMPSRLLSDFVATLPRENIEMTLAERSRQVSLSCARNDASIGGMDPDDFPPIPPVDDSATISVEAARFRRALSQVVFAAAADDSRPVLTGVHFAIDGTEMRLAAADGFRLAVHTLELPDSASECSVIVPARALAELTRLLAEAEDAISVTFNAAGTQVQFDLGHAKLVAQLIQGTFPDTQRLIPEGHTSRTEVAVGEFNRETRIAQIFARDGSGIVRLVASPGEGGAPGRLTISARAEELGTNEGEIDAIVEGEEVKVAFNGRYLREVLDVLDTDRVAIETQDQPSPGVIRPLGDDSYVHVIMPMFVQW